MCYKIEKQKEISIKVDNELKEVPWFIANFFVRYKSAVTKRCNWGYIRALLKWLINKKYIQKDTISDITPEDMRQIIPEYISGYFSDLQNGIGCRKNTLESINTKRNIFGAFWSYLLKRKYVEDNIIQDYGLKSKFKPEIEQKEVEVPSEEQLEEFIRNLNDGNNNEFNIIRNITIVKLFLGSGIRSEELINMDIRDLHLDGDRPYIMVLGKGKKEKYDKVLISDEAKNYLVEYLRSRSIFVKENGIQSNALFLSNEKNRISKTALTNFFDRYSNKTIYPHMLRHYVGTKLYNITKDIVLVQKQLRHTSFEVAARYYVHVDENNMADVIAKL